MISELLKDHGLTLKNIEHIVATGQGRKAIVFADMVRTEITAFAKGAYLLFPEVQVAVDIGGQGIRVMKMGEMGIISDFRTNDKCSSGTGCFMDTMAYALEIGIDKLGDLSLEALHSETISTTCTVFAESEVVSLVAKGKSKESIVSGLNSMVAKKIAALINATRSHGPVFVGGGVALNTGIIQKLNEMLDRKIVVPPDPQFIGAIGAAVLAPKPERIMDMGDKGGSVSATGMEGGGRGKDLQKGKGENRTKGNRGEQGARVPKGTIFSRLKFWRGERKA